MTGGKRHLSFARLFLTDEKNRLSKQNCMEKLDDMLTLLTC